MELQFHKEEFGYLQTVAYGVRSQEQTQEVKLTDAMPDIGSVLGVWGQCLLRGKEWNGGISANGGVMAWVLYAPEDGSTPRCVEVWMPFQQRWELPQTQRDGSIRIACGLKSMDARTVSARRLMVRAVISTLGEALEPVKGTLCAPERVPDGVQLRTDSYPVCLPVEAGEKAFTLEDELPMPASCGRVRKVLRCTVQPELTDRKVMADKVVFRGSLVGNLLCVDEEERLVSGSVELPFSQYGELDGEYGAQAMPDVIPAVTDLETELLENGSLRMKAGVLGQYVIYDRKLLEPVTDAYGLGRDVALQREMLKLPAVLETRQERIKGQQTLENCGEVTDLTLSVGQCEPELRQDSILMEIPGQFTVLAAGEDGGLTGRTAKFSGELPMPGAQGVSVQAVCYPAGTPRHAAAEGTVLQGDVLVDMRLVTEAEIPMVTGLEIGEVRTPDPKRPSLILRRAGQESLWELAKGCGTTAQAIREANGLEEDPQPGQILLIPVS
jgi:hypothetical protein